MGTRAEDEYRRHFYGKLMDSPELKAAMARSAQRVHIKRREHAHRAARAALRRL